MIRSDNPGKSEVTVGAVIRNSAFAVATVPLGLYRWTCSVSALVSDGGEPLGPGPGLGLFLGCSRIFDESLRGTPRRLLMAFVGTRAINERKEAAQIPCSPNTSDRSHRWYACVECPVWSHVGMDWFQTDVQNKNASKAGQRSDLV